jgi:superfamily I DNA/RNA helicase
MITPEDLSFNTNDVTVYLAAAGSGKTTALINETTKLLDIYRPDEIAFLTYTRKGVTHNIERTLQANPQLMAENLIHFKSLHALCFRELGLAHASIINKDAITAFNQLADGFNLSFNEAYERQTADDILLMRYNALRSGSTKGIFIHDPAYSEERYTRLTKLYEEFKREKKYIDFYDCLLRFKEANKPVNVKAALIDEAQDLTLLQWEVCKIAFSLCEKIVIAGDDYQCLFSSLGASPRTLTFLAQRYKTVKLEKSYRLSYAVYIFTKGITELISDKIEKNCFSAKDVNGFVEEITDRSILTRRIQQDAKENGFMPHRWYLLFRNNLFIEEMTGCLEQLVIPYHTSKGFCIGKKVLAKIKRYYNFRKKGFSCKEAFEKFCKDNNVMDINDDFITSDLIPTKQKYTYFDYVQKYGIDELEKMSRKEPFLLLSVTHKVKGGEADHVAVFLDCTQKVYENSQINLDEELRVLYVACSRAKFGLYLVPSRGAYGLDGIVDLVKERAA